MIFFLCLLYVAFRLWNLTVSCLWFDEVFSVHAAEHDWSSLFEFVAQDVIHPPLFYVLLKTWILIGGESLFWLRFFPVFFSFLALVPFYFLCRQLKLTYPTIALALTFIAVNGMLIKYAQELRMYSLLLCLSLFSMWLFARYFNLGKNYKILIIVNILLVYTHYFGWFVVLSQVLLIAVLQNIKIRQILIMLGIALICFTPWIYFVWQESQVYTDLAQNIGWMTRPNFEVILQFVFNLVEPFYFQQRIDAPVSRFLITVPILLIIATAKILYLIKWKNETEKNAFYLLSVFIAVPLLLTFAASWILPHSIWGTRHLIIVFIPSLILAAKFLTEIKSQILKIILISLTILLFILTFILQLNQLPQKFIWCAWDELAQTVDKNQLQKIYVFEDLTAYHFWFSLRDSDNVQIIKVDNIKGIEEDKAYFLPRGFEKVKSINENGIEDERFLIAFKATDWNLSKPPLQNLIAKGYKIGEPQTVEAQGLKAFLVEVKK